MEKSIKVAIGIQARSTSTRLPGKISRTIGNRSVLERVIDACESCAVYINKFSFTHKIHARTFILVPKGDEVIDHLRGHQEKLIEGDEDDVLSRYVKMANEMDANFIVRVTADCPIIPHFVIFKGVNVAAKNGLDYVSNVADLGEEMRTSIDGHDVEVLSRKALEWVDQNAKGKDREHVTALLRRLPPPPDLLFGGLFGHVDFYHPKFRDLKLSLDTEDDFKLIVEMYESIENKMRRFRDVYGRHSVHRF